MAGVEAGQRAAQPGLSERDFPKVWKVQKWHILRAGIFQHACLALKAGPLLHFSYMSAISFACIPQVYHIDLVHSRHSIPHAIKFFFLLTRAWVFPKDRIYQLASLQGTRNDRHWKPDRPVFHLIIAISWPISNVTLNEKWSNEVMWVSVSSPVTCE